MPRLPGNIIWLILGGYFMGLSGWFFGIQHVKLDGIALFPIGTSVVLPEVANATRAANRY